MDRLPPEVLDTLLDYVEPHPLFAHLLPCSRMTRALVWGHIERTVLVLLGVERDKAGRNIDDELRFLLALLQKAGRDAAFLGALPLACTARLLCLYDHHEAGVTVCDLWLPRSRLHLFDHDPPDPDMPPLEFALDPCFRASAAHAPDLAQVWSLGEHLHYLGYIFWCFSGISRHETDICVILRRIFDNANHRLLRLSGYGCRDAFVRLCSRLCEAYRPLDKCTDQSMSDEDQRYLEGVLEGVGSTARMGEGMQWLVDHLGVRELWHYTWLVDFCVQHGVPVPKPTNPWVLGRFQATRFIRWDPPDDHGLPIPLVGETDIRPLHAALRMAYPDLHIRLDRVMRGLCAHAKATPADAPGLVTDFLQLCQHKSLVYDGRHPLRCNSEIYLLASIVLQQTGSLDARIFRHSTRPNFDRPAVLVCNVLLRRDCEANLRVLLQHLGGKDLHSASERIVAMDDKYRDFHFIAALWTREQLDVVAEFVAEDRRGGRVREALLANLEAQLERKRAQLQKRGPRWPFLFSDR